MISSLRRYAAYPMAAATLVFMITGCGDSNVKTAEKSQSQSSPVTQQKLRETPVRDSRVISTVADLGWTVPADWVAGPTRSMRVATYRIDVADSTAECAVFYFGEGQGGTVQANIDRWISQMGQTDGSSSRDKAKIEERNIGGLKVYTVDLMGTYQGAGMAGAESHEEYRLMGAIVHGPKGPVFFKLIGPSDLVANAENGFNQLLLSVKPML